MSPKTLKSHQNSVKNLDNLETSRKIPPTPVQNSNTFTPMKLSTFSVLRFCFKNGKMTKLVVIFPTIHFQGIQRINLTSFHIVCLTHSQFLVKVQGLSTNMYLIKDFIHRELRTKTANKILINLSLSILCLLVSFLAGIQFKSSEDVCPVIGKYNDLFSL